MIPNAVRGYAPREKSCIAKRVGHCGSELRADGGVVRPRNTAAADLTAFQKSILAILADEARYGLAVKSELEEYYGESVNHGRLYPNLEDLIADGLVDKEPLDKRTNEYSLTREGRTAIEADLRWLETRVGGDA